MSEFEMSTPDQIEKLCKKLSDEGLRVDSTENTYTVWFHEGNGENYRVKYNLRSQTTVSTRYNSNGHMNSNMEREIWDALVVLNDYDEARTWHHVGTIREFTGLFTGDNKKIYVGSRVKSNRETEFKVIKLDHMSGIKYALYDGNRPYDLDSEITPNLRLVAERY